MTAHDHPITSFDTCPDCRKRTYGSRKHARRHARKIMRTELSAYECPTHTGWWHLGHLPYKVRLGRLDRRELHRT